MATARTDHDVLHPVYRVTGILRWLLLIDAIVVNARRAGDEHVLVRADPIAGEQSPDHGAVQAARVTVVDVLGHGGLLEASLPQAVGRHSQWHVTTARDAEAVRYGEVIVAPIGNELGFSEDGLMHISDRSWPEPYSPSIDQMMLNLGRQYGRRCGVIAFSGMGSDGSAAAAYVIRQGGVIWTQRAESCACPSMPDSLREAGYSSYSGDPRELATALINHLAEQCA